MLALHYVLRDVLHYVCIILCNTLCNALIHQNFDNGFSSWFLLLKENLKLKIQKAQNKCIRFSLNLTPRSHIYLSHLKKINWLPVGHRIEYCIASTVFKYSNGVVPEYIHEMLKSSVSRYSTRWQMAFAILLQKTNTGPKSLSFLGPKM